ncbi:7648_t:CDS:2 [Entrophospora sp. SA101]|nr:7648_t:CDS:2 [Entrophospora sp. SA101]
MKLRDLVEAPEKCDLDQVKDKIEEIEKHMNNKLEKILAELKSNNK